MPGKCVLIRECVLKAVKAGIWGIRLQIAMHFADRACEEARMVKLLRHSWCIGGERRINYSDSRGMGQLPRKHGLARWRAHGSITEVARESNAFRSPTIQVRSSGACISDGSPHISSVVIGEHEQKIWPPGPLFCLHIGH